MSHSIPINKTHIDTQPHFYIHTCDFCTFRNYKKLNMPLHNGINVIYGDNGAGKSNFLEAISLFAPGKGIRDEAIKNFLYYGKNHFHLSMRVEGPLSTTTLKVLSEQSQTHLSPANPVSLSTEKDKSQKINRIFLADGQAVKRIQDIIHNIRQVWIGTHVERLVSGNDQQKRKFLDRIIALFYPEYSSLLLRYEKVVRTRQHCLYHNYKYHNAWLTSTERQITECAVAIAAMRHEFIEKFNQEGIVFQHNNALGEILPRLKICLDGFVENTLEKTNASDTEDIFITYLSQNRETHKESGRLQQGIHLTHIDFFNCDKNMSAHLCSTGEKKMLGVTIAFIQLHLMKQLSYNFMPILLFDEVNAHLDSRHRSLVFRELKHLGIQVFLTATQYDTFKELYYDAQFLFCENGNIEPK